MTLRHVNSHGLISGLMFFIVFAALGGGAARTAANCFAKGRESVSPAVALEAIAARTDETKSLARKVAGGAMSLLISTDFEELLSVSERASHRIFAGTDRMRGIRNRATLSARAPPFA